MSPETQLEIAKFLDKIGFHEYEIMICLSFMDADIPYCRLHLAMEEIFTIREKKREKKRKKNEHLENLR